MMLQALALLSCFILEASSSQTLVTGKPYIIPACHGVTCEERPTWKKCVSWHIPEGKCCPVCACEDQTGQQFEVNDNFLARVGGKCIQCTCTQVDGVKHAECRETYCMALSCEKSEQIPIPGSCCFKCPPKKPRTFPPVPRRGGFRRPGRRPGFPPRPSGDEEIETVEIQETA